MFAAIRAAHSLMEKPEDPLSNVDPPASMSRNEVESPWGNAKRTRFVAISQPLAVAPD